MGREKIKDQEKLRKMLMFFFGGDGSDTGRII